MVLSSICFLFQQVGDKVNTSARLCKAAYKLESGILCDEATFKKASVLFEFKALEPITVKGKSEKLPIFQPIQKKHKKILHQKLETILIGRDLEFSQMQKVIDETASSKKSSCIFLEG